MKDGYWIVKDIFPEAEFKEIRDHFKSLTYVPFPLDKPQILYLAPVPVHINAPLLAKIEEAVGCEFKVITTYARLNSENHDTLFRIHADSKIYGSRPTHAAVFYLDSHDFAGTGLYEHPVYGRKAVLPEYFVFKEDDGLWSPYLKYFQRENTMLIYESDRYHGRFPWKSFGQNEKDGRIVIINFLQARVIK